MEAGKNEQPQNTHGGGAYYSFEREQRESRRPILIIIALSILATGIVAAIIYFTLTATGVINLATQDSSTASAAATMSELDILKDRIVRYRDNPSADDETLESDLKNYVGKTINEYGKDSSEVADATLTLTSYYEFIGDYDAAKQYLEDRLSVLDDAASSNKYITEIYRLAMIYGDEDSANYYLAQINDYIDSISDSKEKSEKLLQLAWMIYLNGLSYDDEWEVQMVSSDVLAQLKSMIEAAGELNPTAESAILMYYLARDYGSCPKQPDYYYNLAHERDPENYPEPSTEESEDE